MRGSETQDPAQPGSHRTSTVPWVRGGLDLRRQARLLRICLNLNKAGWL
jgi:hypothetical protein